MSTQIQLQINEPCHERWDSMQPVCGGSFCQSCQKTVIDFTSMPDAEIIAFFKKKSNQETVCGRMYADQLDRPFQIPSKTIPWLRYFFGMYIPAMLLSLKADAQKQFQKMHPVEWLSANNKKGHQKLTVQLKGQIVDEFGKAVPFASIQDVDSKMGTTADELGFFECVLPAGASCIEISSVGFQTQWVEVQQLASTISLPAIQLKPVSLIANVVILSRTVVMGGIGFRYTTSQKRQTSTVGLPDKKTSSSVTLYPNPSPREAQVYIKLKEAVSADQQIRITDMNGRLIAMHEWKVNGKQTTVQVPCRFSSAGTYLVSITDRNNRRTSTERLIIQ